MRSFKEIKKQYHFFEEDEVRLLQEGLDPLAGTDDDNREIGEKMPVQGRHVLIRDQHHIFRRDVVQSSDQKNDAIFFSPPPIQIYRIINVSSFFPQKVSL